jgi:hypothetical protein
MNWRTRRKALWNVVANVSGGNWSAQRPDWRDAAARARDGYFRAVGIPVSDLKSNVDPKLDPNYDDRPVRALDPTAGRRRGVRERARPAGAGDRRAMILHCATCGAEWTVPLKLPMLIDRAVRAMKGFVAAGCPACGAHGSAVLCGPKSTAGTAVKAGNE